MQGISQQGTLTVGEVLRQTYLEGEDEVASSLTLSRHADLGAGLGAGLHLELEFVAIGCLDNDLAT